MNDPKNDWYRVPEVWLILFLLGGMVAGSLALVITAVRHPDTLKAAPAPIASPLPPSHIHARVTAHHKLAQRTRR